MKDRVVQHPHRYQLIPVAGQEGTYDIIAKPGTITEPGTPINKATLFSDATAALYGLTGEDAVVDKALSNVTKVAQSASKSYGNVTYTDSMTANSSITKRISIGAGKKFGRAIVATGVSSHSMGIMVEFCTAPSKTLMVGSLNTYPVAGSARSRRHLGSVTEQSPGFGAGATGNYYTIVKEFYINGSNIDIIFEHNHGTAQNLNCVIDWEVW